jgi:hypothetical protein
LRRRGFGLLGGASFRGQRHGAKNQRDQSELMFPMQIDSLNTSFSIFAGFLAPKASIHEGILFLFSGSKLSGER